MTTINIVFANAHTDNTVAEITFNSRKSSYNAMLPFFDKKADKWIIGKQYGYFNAGDYYHFAYAGFDEQEGQMLALEAYNYACATLNLEAA